MLPEDPLARELLAAAIALLLVVGLGFALWRWYQGRRRAQRQVRYHIRTEKRSSASGDTSK